MTSFQCVDHDKATTTTTAMPTRMSAIAATAKTEAILKLARDIVVQRGEVSDADLEQARACGLTDGEIVETVANVALNILTNYVNHVARTVVDFAEVRAGQAEEDWR